MLEGIFDVPEHLGVVLNTLCDTGVPPHRVAPCLGGTLCWMILWHVSHVTWPLIFASIQPIIVRLKTGSADTNRLSSWKGSQTEVRRCMNIMVILWLFVTFVCTFSHLPEKTLTKPMRNTVIIRWIQSVPKDQRHVVAVVDWDDMRHNKSFGYEVGFVG